MGGSSLLWRTQGGREQGVEAFRVTDRLSDADRARLMGGSLARIYNWSPGGG